MDAKEMPSQDAPLTIQSPASSRSEAPIGTTATVSSPRQAQGSPKSPTGQHWDRFEVKLSKPSGKQKLGMVLKHAQVVGEERVKKGAYLAGLANGPSVAQDLGLSPKDRLIAVEGLDVKTVPFERIVGLIRKATFPLTLVWSRQRKMGMAKLPGTAVGYQRAQQQQQQQQRQQIPSASPPTTADSVPPAPGPSPLAAAAVVAAATPVVVHPNAVVPTATTPDNSDNFSQNEGGRSTGAREASSGRVDPPRAPPRDAGDPVVMNGNGVDVGVGVVGGDNFIASSNNAAENWMEASKRGRAAGRAGREEEAQAEAEAMAGLRSARGTPSGSMNQQQLGGMRQPKRLPTIQQQLQYSLEQSAGHGSRHPQVRHGYHYQNQNQDQEQYQQHKRHRRAPSGGRPLSGAAAEAVAEVMSHQGFSQAQGLTGATAAAATPGNRASGMRMTGSPRGVDEGVGAAGMGIGVGDGVGQGQEEGEELTEEEREEREAREAKAEKERKADAMRARRRERDKARREKVRREMAAGGTMRLLHEQRQDQARASSGAGSASGAGGQHQGSRGRRQSHGRGGATGDGNPEGADGGAGTPEWLKPLMKAELKGFVGTRYARSRLKQTLSHEWAQQEYRNGITMRQVDRSVTELEFMRRRVAGGSLYALLEQESREYLRPGAFTDADMELIGKDFAQMASTENAEKVSPAATATDLDAAARAGTSIGDDTNVGGPSATAVTPVLTRGQASTAGGSSVSKAKPDGEAGRSSGPPNEREAISWSDRLRNYQIDVPAAVSYDLTADGEDANGVKARGGTGTAAGSGPQGGADGVRDGGAASAWDGRGVDANTVIQHRRRFDARCTAYEALNNNVQNEKTSALLQKTQRLHQEHATVIVAKRATLEGTLENVRSQLQGREEQLRMLRLELAGVNPRDPQTVAILAENEAAMLSRVNEKKVQMAMIIDEANKVVEWERAAELANREAMQHAADMHGQGGAKAAEAAKERAMLVQAMMSQKANIMLLSTFCKLRGPWLAPSGHGRKKPAAPPSASATPPQSSDDSLAAPAESGSGNDASGAAEKGTVRGMASGGEERQNQLQLSVVVGGAAGRSSLPASVGHGGSSSSGSGSGSSGGSSGSSSGGRSTRDRLSTSQEREERRHSDASAAATAAMGLKDADASPVTAAPTSATPTVKTLKSTEKKKTIKLRLLPPTKRDPGKDNASRTPSSSGSTATAKTPSRTTPRRQASAPRDDGDEEKESLPLPAAAAVATEDDRGEWGAGDVESPPQESAWSVGGEATMATVLARGGKEAAMARLAGAGGLAGGGSEEEDAAAARPDEAEDDGSMSAAAGGEGVDGSAPEAFEDREDDSTGEELGNSANAISDGCGGGIEDVDVGVAVGNDFNESDDGKISDDSEGHDRAPSKASRRSGGKRGMENRRSTQKARLSRDRGLPAE